jgi:hypothetical protein
VWETVHDLRHEDQTAGMEATDLRFALWPQLLLTARHHAARSAMAVKDQAEKGATFEDSAALFERLLIAAVYATILRLLAAGVVYLLIRRYRTVS